MTESLMEPRSSPDDITLDQLFEVLSNERRRRVLRFLLDESERTSLGTLAEHIASLENDKPVDALTSTERKRVYICLYQSHLPKMDDVGVIDFDDERKTVEAGEHIEAVARFPLEQPVPESDSDADGWLTDAGQFVRSLGRHLRRTL